MRPRSPCPIPVHVLGGRDDDINAERLEAWRREAGDVFSLDWFDGSHFFVRRQENQVLTAIVRKLMHPFSGVIRAATATA